MTEAEYLRATNRAKISMAKNIVKDVVPGAEYGITDGSVAAILGTLSHHEAELFGSYSLADEDDNPTDAEKAANYWRARVTGVEPDWIPARINLLRALPFQNETIGPGAFDCVYHRDCCGCIFAIGEDGGQFLTPPAQYEVLEWRKNEADNA